uniref:Uncharacterized protein n=1 Tax=Arundo donax TaxID=35708 RepID=A0A0A9FFY4_ARUDO
MPCLYIIYPTSWIWNDTSFVYKVGAI